MSLSCRGGFRSCKELLVRPAVLCELLNPPSHSVVKCCCLLAFLRASAVPADWLTATLVAMLACLLACPLLLSQAASCFQPVAGSVVKHPLTTSREPPSDAVVRLRTYRAVPVLTLVGVPSRGAQTQHRT
jgi:hypothetical protein